MRTGFLKAVLLACALPFAACDCNNKLVSHPECEKDTDCKCANGEASICVQGKCAAGNMKCKGDNECCPGQLCNTDLGRCRDKFTECTADADCKADDSWNGQTCVQDDTHKTKSCRYSPCDNTGACPSGQQCFARGVKGYDRGICIVKAPCGGGCASTDLCVIADDRCYTPPASACPGCQPGFAPLLDDPTNVFGNCHIGAASGTVNGAKCSHAGVGCVCAELPPLVTHDTGRYDSLVKVDNQFFISYYDGTFGDLVFETRDATGKLVGKAEYLDGVPANGKVVGGPSGPRGGIADAGDDVGRYTSLAVDPTSKDPRIAYYDVTHKALKFAARTGTTWATHTVDANGDVGRYAFLTIDTKGIPYVFYFQNAGKAPDVNVTALKLAKGKKALPTAAADWDLVVMDTGTHAPLPCNGGCANANQVCVNDGSGNPTCADTSTACGVGDAGAACSTSQVCVSVSGKATCGTQVNVKGLAALPKGNGLWPTAAWRSGHLVVAWFDNLNGLLKAAEDNGAGGFNAATLDSGGVGKRPSLVVDGANIALSYGTAAGTLKFYLGPDLTADPTRLAVIDDGGRDPAGDALAFAGADDWLVSNGSGSYYVAYQDQTQGDLVIKKRDATSGKWTAVTQIGKGDSVGFYNQLVFSGGKLYATHVHGKAVATQDEHYAGYDLRFEVTPVP